MQALPMPIPDPPIQYTKVSIRFSVTVLCTGFYVIKKEKNDPILCAWDFFYASTPVTAMARGNMFSGRLNTVSQGRLEGVSSNLAKKSPLQFGG